MVLNSSSSADVPDLPFSACYITKPSSLMYLAYFITNILVLVPLCTFILYLRLQQWWQQRSTSAAAMTSHSDSFTYHLVAMQLVGVLGFVFCCCGIFTVHVNIYWVGFCLWSFPWYGEMYFNVLTCVERYLAVVHPLLYLSLRNARGIRIRNICNASVWLLCCGGVTLMSLTPIYSKVHLFLYVFSFTVVSFCSLSVLVVLIRPGPGEQGRDRERVDQTKQKAFYTILAIMGVLLLRFIWNITYSSLSLSDAYECTTTAAGVWFNLPCRLLLPLLFLLRVGICTVCCRNKSEDNDDAP